MVLLAVGVGFAVNAALGVYQAGAEWKFWDPPSTCAAAAGLPTFDAKSLSMDRVPALCGVASWRCPRLVLCRLECGDIGRARGWRADSSS